MSKKTKRQPIEAVPEDTINIDSGVIEIPAEKTLVDQIREQRALASQDLNDVPANARAAFSIAKANAADIVRGLEKEYADFVAEASLFLILEGKPEACQAFADIAREIGPVAVLDCNKLYERLADVVIGSMHPGAKEFDTIQYIRLIEALTDLGQEMGIASLPRPAFRTTAFAREEEIAPFVRGLIEERLGTELSVLSLRTELHKQAVDIGFSNVVPAVVLNVSNVQELKQNLLRSPDRAMTLKVEDEVTEEAVEVALSQLAQLA